MYGRIGKGFYFEKKSAQAIDIENSKSETVENDRSKIFDASVAEFIFVPEAHRFCIQLGSKISGNDVKKFFINALMEVKDKSDVVRVEIETEPKAIDEILTAKKIHKIDYVVTYTNDDVLKTTGDLFDQRLKRSQIGKIEIKAESDHNEFLNVEGEELLEGGIELAQSNGTIRSATITTSDNKKKIIKSKEVPLRLEIVTKAEKFRNYLVNLVMRSFRPNANDA